MLQIDIISRCLEKGAGPDQPSVNVTTEVTIPSPQRPGGQSEGSAPASRTTQEPPGHWDTVTFMQDEDFVRGQQL